MASITLELIASASGDYDFTTSITLPMVFYVLKPIEQFRYQVDVPSSSVPIVYVENKPLDSHKNLVIVDKSYLVPENSKHLLEAHGRIIKLASSSFSGSYKDIAVTNVVYTDDKGRDRPLFFKHRLPLGVTQVSLTRAFNGNRQLVDTGYLVDLANSAVYTNHLNMWHEPSGSYSVYLVHYTTADGTTAREILNPMSVVNEATWEDIDQTTGNLVDTALLYTKEKTASGYTFYFNKAATWYIKPLDSGLLSMLKPSFRRAYEPWYPRFTNGDVIGTSNSNVYRYWLPDYDQQPFFPYKPIIYSSYGLFDQITPRIIVAPRNNISIDPNVGLHIELRITDADDVLVKVFTSDESKAGARFSDTAIYYEVDGFDSWDLRSGMLLLNTSLLPEWKISGSFYYTANDLELQTVDLNPINNALVKDHMYVFYCTPNANEIDSAIHYLIVNHSGIIVFCSQSLGLTYPNLMLLNQDGSYNTHTVVGKAYVSATSTDTFLDQYAAGYGNSYGYLILSEVNFADIAAEQDQLVFDVSRPMGINPNYYTDAFADNYRLLQSEFGYGTEGQEVPVNGVMIIDAPLSLLEDYGGTFAQQEAEDHLRKHMTAAGYGLIRWRYPASPITAISDTVGLIRISTEWVGPDLTYYIQESTNANDAWVTVETFTDPARTDDLTFGDTRTSGSILYYRTIIEDANGITYPEYNIVSIEVL